MPGGDECSRLAGPDGGVSGDAAAGASEDLLGRVLEIGAAINGDADLPRVLEAVCDAARATGWSRAAIVLWGPEGGGETTFGSSGVDPGALAAVTSQLPAATERGRVFAEGPHVGRSVRVDGLEAAFAACEAAEPAGLLSPVECQEETIGALGVDGPSGAAGLEERAWRLERLADLAAVAVRVARSAEALRRLRDLVDPLTPLANRRGFEKALRREVERAYRASLPLSILAIDLDRLERINEVQGRAAGDGTIKAAAGVLREGLRQVDMAARFGGGEFCVLLPGATADGAREVAERLRCAIAAANIPGGGAVTATFGVATLSEHAANGAGLLQAASAALEVGKRRGRNRVAVAIPLARR